MNMANKPIKIVIISHALVIDVNQNRWKRLSQDKTFEVHLLVPAYWETEWFGKDERKIYNSKEIHKENFHIHPIPTTSIKNWSRYLFKSIDCNFRKINPDLIYIIHEESVLLHQQIYLYKKLFSPEAKIIFFSMNSRGIPYQNTVHPIKRFIYKWMWENIKKNTDAALVHYPGCLDSLRSGGYNKPIYLQTQVGVDETLFSPSNTIRCKFRQKIAFEDMFVIGYAGRLTVDKGVDDLVAVFIKLAKKYTKIALLLVGNGELRESIEKDIVENGLQYRVHVTGFVDQAEVPNYMNSMDTFVLGSKTMPHWMDTFPLVTVQAQATNVPVIASDSASIPWQLDKSAKIYKEGNRDELYRALELFINDRFVREEYSIKGKIRSNEYFCHIGMTESFKKIVEQVMSGDFVFHEKNEKYIQWKAY